MSLRSQAKSQWKLLLATALLLTALWGFSSAKADLTLAGRFIELILQSGQTQDPLAIKNSTDTLFIVYKNGSIKSIGEINATGTVYSQGLAVLTGETGDISSVTAGSGLTGGGTTGAVTLNVSGVASSMITDGTIAAADLVADLGLGWGNLTSYPAACPAGQAVQTLGDTVTCVSAGTGNVSGTGNASYFPFWLDPSTLGNSMIYQSANKIGIDTTSLSSKLKVTNPNGSLDAFLVQHMAPTADKSLFITATGLQSDDVGYSAVQTSDGGYAMAGYTNSFGAGGTDFLLVKFNSTGSVEWARAVGGSFNDVVHSARALQQTSDGGYVVSGYTTGPSLGAGSNDFFLVKFNGTGSLEWARTAGNSSGDIGYSVRQTSDGGYIMAGYLTSVAGFGLGSNDYFIVKFNSTGGFEWAKAIGSNNGDDVGVSAQQTSDGGYIVGGYSSFFSGTNDFLIVKLNSSGNISWATTIGGTGSDVFQDVLQTSDGGYLVTGYTDSFGAGGNDFFVAKLNSAGNVSWATTIGGTGGDIGYTANQTSDGGYIVGGYSPIRLAGSEFLLVKLNSSGNLSWAKTFGGSSAIGLSARQTSDGGYVMGGYKSGFGAGATDFLLVKTDSNGNVNGCQDVNTVLPTITLPSVTVTYPSLNITNVTPNITSPSLTPASKSQDSTSMCFGQGPSALQDIFVISSSGNIGIGTNNATNILTIKRASSTDPVADSWSVYSSRRWKENIREIRDALDKVLRLRGVSFSWKDNGKQDIGMIAEEVGEVLPELVVYEENGKDAQSLDYARLVAVLVEAIKEQQKEIDNLKSIESRVALLEGSCTNQDKKR